MKWIHVLGYISLLCSVKGTLGEYYGVKIGSLENTIHGVSGDIYAATENAFYLKDFSYDGQGPDAFFIVGKTEVPDISVATILADEKGSIAKLRRYDKESFVIVLPDGKKITDYKYVGVYCRQARVSFGHSKIPSGFKLPMPQDIGQLAQRAHQTRSKEVTLLDSKTILVRQLHYDGRGPDAFFIAGKGAVEIKPTTVKIPDEAGRTSKLRRYNNEDITLTLPGNHTWADFDYFALYCIAAVQNFGEVYMPNSPTYPVSLMHATGGMSGIYSKRYGKLIGKLQNTAHNVEGDVYYATDNTFVVTGFSFDGTAPSTYFIAGTTDTPDENGRILEISPNAPKERQLLKKYTNELVVVNVPSGTIKDFKYFSVYCTHAKQSFGHVQIPSDFKTPEEAVLPGLETINHGVKSKNVIIKDSKTIVLTEFSYDGTAPRAFFTVSLGKINEASIIVPDETKNRTRKLGPYNNQDVELTLPAGITVFDIDRIGVYCFVANALFGERIIDHARLNVPSSMKELLAESEIFNNCEELEAATLQVSWALMDDRINIRLKGFLKDEPLYYIAFGISGSDDRVNMDKGDVAIVFIDAGTGYVTVKDYYLERRAQCVPSKRQGVCPDEALGGANDITLESSSFSNGVLTAVFSRLLKTNDRFDREYKRIGNTTVIYGLGKMAPDDNVITKHYTVSRRNVFIDFSREAKRNCPSDIVGSGINPVVPATTPKPSTENSNGFSGLVLRGVQTFTARIGPSGGKRGVPALTNTPGWGYAWWINNNLLPVLELEAGTEYKFIVEGGDNETNTAQYHPLVITNDNSGGYLRKTESSRKGIIFYAGAELKDGQVTNITGKGRYCELIDKTSTEADMYETIDDFKKNLVPNCEKGKPGEFTWSPSEDLIGKDIYYQCFSHSYFGWKVRVVKKGSAMGMNQDGGNSASPVKAYFSTVVLLLVSLIYFHQ